MELKQLLATTPESLAQTQLDALRKEVVSRLGRLAGHIERSEWKAADAMLMSSPAGDCMGCDNMCINFSDILTPSQEGCSMDISDVITYLIRLESMITAGNKAKQK